MHPRISLIYLPTINRQGTYFELEIIHPHIYLLIYLPTVNRQGTYFELEIMHPPISLIYLPTIMLPCNCKSDVESDS